MTARRATQTPRYERKREDILEAAATLFNARGLAGATIADVAQAVGLNTTSVTYYYRKKEDLAAACLTRAVEVMDNLLTQAQSRATDGPEARLTSFLDLYFGRLAETAQGRAPAMINFWDLRALTGPPAAATMGPFIALFRRVRTLFQTAGGPALSRPEQNARAHLVFSAVIRSKGWVDRYDPEDYPRAAARMADILVHGVAGPGQAWRPPMLDLQPEGRSDGGEVSRQTFLRAATELINEHGYRAASVDRISARLNVTKGSFYHHNETKDDLVGACFGHTFEVIRRAHRAAMTSADTGWDRLCAVSAALVRRQLTEHGPLLRLSALSATVEAKRPGLLAELARVSEKTAALVADGIADGSIRPVDPAIMAQLVTGMTNAAAELARWSPAATAENAGELFAKPLMIGVFSPPMTR